MPDNNPKILIVDDSEANRLLLSFMLQELGFKTESAENGEKGVEMALEYDYCAIFMDLNMPVMGGVESMEILRGINFEEPIFVCSAENNSSKIERLISSGFTDFICKPIEPKGVQELLEKH